METLEIKKKDALKAFSAGDESAKQLLRNLFGAKVFDAKITDRVKTFEDACEIVGEDPEDDNFITGTDDEIAYKKLKVICRALNEGTVLSFANSSQRKWRPWFQWSGSGFRYDDAFYVAAGTASSGGSRLCFHSEELAIYAGQQFIDLYNQLLK